MTEEMEVIGNRHDDSSVLFNNGRVVLVDCEGEPKLHSIRGLSCETIEKANTIVTKDGHVLLNRFGGGKS